MNSTDFFARYDEWLEACREQLQQTFPEALDGHCEICEDGSVYLGNLSWLPKGTCTPWEQWSEEDVT